MRSKYPKGLGYWSVQRKEEPRDFLGWILLLPYRAVGEETEVGWRFVRTSWGYGYATEAASVAVQHAFDTVGTAYLVADIDPRNAASIRVAEKLGMRFVEDRNLNGSLAKSYQIRSDDWISS